MESPSLCRKGPTTEAEGRIKRDAVSKPEARNKSNAQPLAKKMSTIAFRRHGECASARAQPVHHGGHAAPQEPAYRQAHKPDGAEPHIARGDDRLALAAAKAEIKKAFIALSIKYHPDKQHTPRGNGTDEDTDYKEIFQQIKEARDGMLARFKQ